MTEAVKERKDAQDQCITEHDGKWLVIAGPGTGKTYTVTHRIADMIKKGISPESILCLTFTDIAAREMSQKIGEKYPVDIFTYHGFCSSILNEYSEELGFEKTPAVITDDAKRSIITACIDNTLQKRTAELLEKDLDEDDVKGFIDGKNPYTNIKNILDGIDRIKMERISKEEFEYNYTNHPAWLPHLNSLKEIVSNDAKLREYILNVLRPTKPLYAFRFCLALRNNEQPTPADTEKFIDWEKKQKEAINEEIKKMESRLAKMAELWDFYEQYEALKKEENLIDFNDMINLVLNKFDDKKSNLLNEISRKYEYIIVDEYQDTNTAQNQLVFRLAKSCPNVFVVGDDDQIIYTFQGAHLDTIQKFLDEARKNEPVGDVNVKCFTKNYRSTQPVLDVSRALAELQDDNFYRYMAYKGKVPESEKDKELKLRFLSQNPIVDDNGDLLIKKLVSSDDKLKNIKDPVEYKFFEDKEQERDYIVKRIIQIKDEIDNYNKNLPKGEEKKLYSDIAVLVYTNRDLTEYADYLKVNKIPVETLGKNIFEITAVNVFISYLQFLTNPERYSDKLMSYLLLNPFHINPKDYAGICANKTHHKTLIGNIKSYIYKKEHPAEPDVEPVEKTELKEFVRTYEYLQDYVTSANYKTSLLEIGSCTGIFDYYFNKEITDKIDSMKGIKKILELADSYFDVNKDQKNSFTMFVQYLSKMLESGTVIKLDKNDKPANAVQLSTLHSSKGREFEHVFMPMLVSGQWDKLETADIYEFPEKPVPNQSYEQFLDSHYQEQYLDSIKLLYVGMTRAKRELLLSYANVGGTFGTMSWFFQQLVQNSEITNEEAPLLVPLSDKKLESALAINTYEPKPSYDFETEIKTEIEPLIPNRFSFSGLKSYLACPKQYFYKYVFGLRVNSGNKDALSLGSAVHKAFEEACIYAMNNKEYPDANYAQEHFEKELSNLEISNPDYTKYLTAKKIFSEKGFYNEYYVKLLDADEIAKDAIYEKNPVLTKEEDGKKIYVEYPLHYEMDMPEEWRTSMDDKDVKIIFDGYIDRIDKDDDGKYIVYDYKTDAKIQNITPTKSHFKQMVFYKYVLEHQFPGIEVKECYILYPIEEDKNYKVAVHDKFVTSTSKKTTDNYQNQVNDFEKAIEGIRKMDFDKLSETSSSCTFCNYKFICHKNLIGCDETKKSKNE